jgi:SAM-dependent methyltransferase
MCSIAQAGRGDHALEVGAGTGNATRLFAGRGLAVSALEPSAEMAQIARRNAGRCEHVSIEQTEFERWRPRERFRLSSQPRPGTGSRRMFDTRAHEAWIGGGALAVFWNRVRWEDVAVREELRDAYRRFAPQLGSGVGPGPMHPAVQPRPGWWHDEEEELGKGPGFADPELRAYNWSERYETETYVQLLQTHSDHIVFEPAQRESLLEAVAGVLDRHGGGLDFQYMTVLAMARRTGGMVGAG